MRTKLRSKVTLLFMTLGLLIAVPAVALAADLNTDVNADLSSDINARTEVYPNSTNDFDVKVWATGNLASGSGTDRGIARIVNTYNMSAAGTSITAGTSTTQLNFKTDHHYGSVSNTGVDNTVCPATVPTQVEGVTGKGCKNDPFIVPAELIVGNVTPPKDATLTVSGTTGAGLDIKTFTWDQGFVRVVQQPPSNNAPTVSTDAGNVSGDEGSRLTNSGAFSDANTDQTLSITKKSGVGTVTPSTTTRGAWSWSYTPTDNGSGTVEVEVSDGNGGTAVDSFTWTANNVDPTATFNSPDVDEGSNISLSLIDPVDPAGSNDTLSYAFDCGDGNGYVADSDGATTCSTNDNGSRNVKGKIMDEDGGETEYTDSVTIRNVAPTASFEYPSAAVNEGSPFTLKLTSPVDPAGSNDTLSYAFDCGDGSFAADADGEFSCSTNDNGTRTVRAKIMDEDGGSTVYPLSGTVNVSVVNVAPTATFNYPSAAINEGDSFELSLTSPFDPAGTNDTLSYAFDCGDGSGFVADADGVASCSTNDNGTRIVRGKIMDEDGGSTEYPTTAGTATVTVNNVAPTADLSSPDVNEGSAIVLTLTNADDVSSADEAAGFTYAFDCNTDDATGYSSFSDSNTVNCPTNDNGTRNVGAKIKDKDGDASTYTDSVTISNVDPTATFNKPTSVVEGSNINLSLTNPVDPGSADVLSYAFDCGDGNGYVADSDGSVSCSTNDNGSRSVKGKIMDDDGGFTEYTATVSITNANPVISTDPLSLTGASGTACLSGNTVTLNPVSFTDVGTADTHTATVEWGDANDSSDVQALTINQGSGSGSTNSLQHSYGAGTYTLTVTITDDDGGPASKTASVSRLYNMSSIQSPFNPDGSSVFKYGSTVPVKVKITDCNGASVPGLAPKLGVRLFSPTAPVLGVNEDAYSTSNADTGNTLRYDASAGHYIYNYNTKSNQTPDSSASYYMVVEEASSTPNPVSQKFGLKLK